MKSQNHKIIPKMKLPSCNSIDSTATVVAYKILIKVIYN